MISLVGKKNVYKCNSCKKKVITIDIDDGASGSQILCLSEGCYGIMYSQCYPVQAQKLKVEYEWYSPDIETVLYNRKIEKWEIEAIKRGALYLCRIQT